MINVQGNIVDIVNRKIYPGILTISKGKITKIQKTDETFDNYLIPGFIDSHIHIESSMLPPIEFGRIAVSHGTISVVCDPHEIANVNGLEGINYMIENSKQSPLKFFFAAPSCVPATPFDKTGFTIDSTDIDMLLAKDEIKSLAEFMNFPGVITQDGECMAKLQHALKHKKPVDGHAPGLSGLDLKTYIDAGISTDHECTVLPEALEKIEKGMKIQIREGSACKDFEALHTLIKSNPDKCMFCSDDLHPDDLFKGHINLTVKRSLALGYNLFDILRIASLNPINHYKLDVGLLQEGDSADFLVLDDLNNIDILESWINGEKTFQKNNPILKYRESAIINNFKADKKTVDDFKVKAEKNKIKIIVAKDGVVTTGKRIVEAKISSGLVTTDIDKDILKIVVVNRYQNLDPGIAFIKGFGLKKGAIASSVAHDSHNIIAVGVDDQSICEAVNTIIAEKGGISCSDEKEASILPLPIAGIISGFDYQTTSQLYQEIDQKAKKLGSTLKAPFMTLSFMGLLVIPELKINESGLFDALEFKNISMWTD